MATYNSNTAREYQLIVEITEAGSPDIPNNRSKLNWTVKLKQGQYRHAALCTYNLTINGVAVWKSASGGTTVNSAAYAQNTTFTLASGTTDWITHGSDGKKTVAISASYKTNNQTSGVIWICPLLSLSGSFAITTIPRASSISSFPNFTIGNSFTVTLSRASSSFTHNLTLKVGSIVITSVTGVGTSYAFSLTTAEENKIYQATPNADKATITLTCQTRSGSSNIGSAVSKNATASMPSSIVPTIGSITHEEAVAAVTLSGVGNYIQSISRVDMSIIGAAGVKYSTIKSYSITVDGKTYNSQSAISNVIQGNGQLKITGKVTDSRGRTVSQDIFITVTPYSKPKITLFKIERCNSLGITDPMGGYAIANAIGGAISIKPNDTELNHITYYIRYRIRNTTTWNTLISDTTGIELQKNGVIGEVDPTVTYDFRLEITDLFSTDQKDTILPTGAVPMSWGKEGVGFGKVWEQGALDITGSIYVNNIEKTAQWNSAYNYSLVGHLPLTGGIITGDLSVESDIIANREIILPYWDKDGYSAAIRVIRTSGRRYLMIDSGHQGGNVEGAKIYVYNNEDAGNPGQVRIYPGSGSSLKFVMYNDGSSRFYGDLRVDGVIKIPHAVGGPATFQVSGASGRQIAYLMADGTTNTDIRLYGPQDNSIQSQISLRTDGSNALIIYSDQRARFYGDVRVDGAFTNPSLTELKTNIKVVSTTNCYNMLKALKFKTYNLKSELEKKEPEEVSNFLGLMVEESPEIIKGKDGESINIINYISLIGAALQETQRRLETVEKVSRNV